MSHTTRILLAHDAARACFQVLGRGDVRCSSQLQKAIRHLREAGCRVFAFDLRECPAMDSTFIGVMVGPLRRLPHGPGGEPCEVVVCRADERVRETLEDMGIAPLVTFAEECPAPADFAPNDAVATADQTELARTSMEAHQTLISLNPEKNAPRFRDVVAFLEEEVTKKSGDAPSS
jgi:anti-anti-sigma regulatory factor